MSTNSLPPTKSSWKKPFFTIWTGQAFSIFGSQLVQFALIWYLTKSTGSATVLAMASMAGILPQVFIAPFAGAVVDRLNRRLVMIVSDACVALATLALAVLFAFGVVQVWHIYLVMFIRSICGNFQSPAMMASTSLMVPNEHLTRIQGMNTMLSGALGILSAPLGALLMEVLPLYGIIGIDVVTALIAILPLFFIAIPQPAADSTPEHTTHPVKILLSDMKAGLKYVINWRGLLIICLSAMMINFLFAPAGSLMPLLVKQHFQGGALQLAWIEIALGIGAVVGGLLLSAWSGFKNRIHTSMLGLSIMGIGTLMIASAPPQLLYLALAGQFISGFANPITNGPLLAILQAIVDPKMQGRVFSLVSSSCTAMIPIGLAMAGPMSDWIGIQTWYWISGCACFVMSVGMLLIPSVVNIEKFAREKGEAVATAEAVAAPAAEIQ